MLFGCFLGNFGVCWVFGVFWGVLGCLGFPSCVIGLLVVFVVLCDFGFDERHVSCGCFRFLWVGGFWFSWIWMLLVFGAFGINAGWVAI